MSKLVLHINRLGVARSARVAIPFCIFVAIAMTTVLATSARAQCVLLEERQAPDYTPHIAVHFGDPSEVPGRVQCSSFVDKRSGYWCVPVYAWNLWDDVQNVEFAIRTPIEPTGFDRGPQISGVQMQFASDEDGTITSFQLSASAPLCGPVLLGCLRLATEKLPTSFSVSVEEHAWTHRRAVQGTSGNWRTFSVRGDGSVGGIESCGNDTCGINHPVANLSMRNGNSPGRVEMSWTSGTGSFTLLRYRTDGRYPRDPWDGTLLAFLPSSIQGFETRVEYSGDIHVTAWSVSRGLNGRLLESSNIECGSVSSLLVHQPIAIEQSQWHQVKKLFR